MAIQGRQRVPYKLEQLQKGDYLLYRHNLLNQFLCYINHSDNELEQVERIEHFIDERTIRNIAIFLESAL